MKRTIWEFPVKPNAKILMPLGAEILTVQIQSDEPTIWAIVDPSAEGEQREFRTIPTGEIFDPFGLKYVGTFQFPNGGVNAGLAFHLFEVE